MTDGMSLGRQQAGQLAGTLTGPPERGHGIASGIRVNQSFQLLDQLGVVLDQRLPSSSRVPYSLNGERWLSKALDSPIDGRTRESGKTGDAGNTPSSQLLCIDGSNKVLLSLIQVRKQQAVFLLKFFCCAHRDSVTQCASFVTIINLRALIRGNRSRVEGDKRTEAHGAAKIPPGCVGRCDRRGFQEKQDRRPESPNPAPRHCDYVCTNSSDVLETPHVKNPISPRLRQVLLISSVVLLPVLGYFRPAHLPDRVNPVHLRIVALRPVPLVMEVRLQP